MNNLPTRIPQPNDQLDLFSVTEIEADGIQMGVLNDGTPYLTARGLAKICGTHNSTILDLANNWDKEKWKPRGKRIFELLVAQGHPADKLFVTTKIKNQESHAYSDAVSMAFLEYYAFEAGENRTEAALRNYRFLARYSIRNYIYNRCGYDPSKLIPESWRNFHERVLLNDQIPFGFFSVFREVADLMIHMIQNGCNVDSHSVPDGSIGIHWGKNWTNNGLESQYGQRHKHPHVFPEWYPQSQANPIEAWIYPVEALGEFRKWLYSTYVNEKFPNYLQNKVKQGIFPPSSAELMIESVKRKEIGN
jgi:hypothetical protein